MGFASFVQIPRHAWAVAKELANKIEIDLRLGAARRVPESVTYCEDLGVDTWGAPEDLLERGCGDCVWIVRAEGAYLGTHVGAVQDPVSGKMHVFLLDRPDAAGREIHDPGDGSQLRGILERCVPRGMQQPELEQYRGMWAVPIQRPATRLAPPSDEPDATELEQLAGFTMAPELKPVLAASASELSETPSAQSAVEAVLLGVTGIVRAAKAEGEKQALAEAAELAKAFDAQASAEQAPTRRALLESLARGFERAQAAWIVLRSDLRERALDEIGAASGPAALIARVAALAANLAQQSLAQQSLAQRPQGIAVGEPEPGHPVALSWSPEGVPETPTRGMDESPGCPGSCGTVR